MKGEWRMTNDDSVFNYFIKMKDYIVKTTRGLWAEWTSRNTLYVKFSGCLFIWLYENTGADGAVDDLPRSTNSKKRKISY